MRLMKLGMALCLMASGWAQADTTTTFPASTDDYDYAFYPYMFFPGDQVIGEREVEEDIIDTVSFTITNDTQFLYCEAQINLVIDGQVIAELDHIPGAPTRTFSGNQIPVQLAGGHTHRLELIRITADMDDCGSVIVIEDESEVTFHGRIVPDGVDEDGDGFDSVDSGGNDCDDGDDKVFPGAPESCNGQDEDCDDAVDEGAENTYYYDEDRDGYGNSDFSIQSCEIPPDHASVGGDCDDADAEINPGATDICNGLDDNCDGEVDENGETRYFYDGDADGYGVTSDWIEACDAPADYASTSGDCDDDDASINPGAEEICDGVDNNCNITVDEGLKSTYYPDEDRDGYGDTTQAVITCDAPVGYVDVGGDCDDSTGAVHPAASEVCDGLDNDCDGDVDNRDMDDDGYVAEACDGRDCDDTRADVNPGADDLPGDGVDNDCDDEIDEEEGGGCDGAQGQGPSQGALFLFGLGALFLGRSPLRGKRA